MKFFQLPIINLRREKQNMEKLFAKSINPMNETLDLGWRETCDDLYAAISLDPLTISRWQLTTDPLDCEAVLRWVLYVFAQWETQEQISCAIPSELLIACHRSVGNENLTFPRIFNKLFWTASVDFLTLSVVVANQSVLIIWFALIFFSNLQEKGF